MPGINPLINKTPVFIQRSVGLGDNIIFLLIGSDIDNLVGNYAFFLIYFSIRGLNKTEFIDPGISA
jgi:hypothetical protein